MQTGGEYFPIPPAKYSASGLRLRRTDGLPFAFASFVLQIKIPAGCIEPRGRKLYFLPTPQKAQCKNGLHKICKQSG